MSALGRLVVLALVRALKSSIPKWIALPAVVVRQFVEVVEAEDRGLDHPSIPVFVESRLKPMEEQCL